MCVCVCVCVLLINCYSTRKRLCAQDNFAAIFKCGLLILRFIKHYKLFFDHLFITFVVYSVALNGELIEQLQRDYVA